MDLSSGVNVGQLGLAIGTLLVTGGLTFGGLLQRVKTLERQVAALSGFDARLARIEERTERILDTLTNSWLLKDPPSYVTVPATPPTSRRRTGGN